MASMLIYYTYPNYMGADWGQGYLFLAHGMVFDMMYYC